MTEIAKYSEEGRGGGTEVPHPAQQGRVREGPLAWCPQLRHGSAQAKLLFKRFSWRHKGLLTSLMPPFNTELFRIPSRLCFYSEWQGTFPLGKLEKCFWFFFSFFLPFQLASIFHPKSLGWWWQLRRQRARLSTN